MSEYWVSKKKYFCKYCDIYIADDAPSRQHHESGMRHKGNVDRFIRGLYKGSEKRKKELEEEKRDMARVEQAARAAFAQDVASGLAKASAPVPSTSKAAAKPAPKPSNPYANYSTAESLGYTDPDAERIAAELERRRTQGAVGDWEVVSTGPSTSALEDESELNGGGADEETKPSLAALDGEGSQGGVKREAEAPPEEDDERTFKLRRKTVGVGLGEIYDPGAIKIKVKKKEEPAEPVVPPPAPSTSDQPAPSTLPSTVPKWTPLQLKKPGGSDATPIDSTDPQAGVKAEERPDTLPSESASDQPAQMKWSKIQWSASAIDAVKEEGKEPSSSLNGPSNLSTEMQETNTSTNTSPPVKNEPDAGMVPKLEDTSPASLDVPPPETGGGGMFRKRKIPAKGGKRSS